MTMLKGSLLWDLMRREQVLSCTLIKSMKLLKYMSMMLIPLKWFWLDGQVSMLIITSSVDIKNDF